MALPPLIITPVVNLALTMKALLEKSPDSVRFLPSIYHEDAERKFSPLWALLLIIEETFGSIEEKIDQIDRYFDIYAAPAGHKPGEKGENDFLSWLASLLALEFGENWSDAKKRYVLSIAADLYKLRGTIKGLEYMLCLYFGIDVEIQEWTWPQGMQVEVSGRIGVDSILFDRPNLNHCFTLIWRPDSCMNKAELETKIKKIRDLIDREKPAHTKCYFEVKPPEEALLSLMGCPPRPETED